MVYGAGILGFLGGFCLGQVILFYLLKDRPKEELVNNKALRWTYGIFNWAIAFIGAWAFVHAYRVHF